MDSQVRTILAPREGVNDDVVRVVEWLVAEGDTVREAQAIVVLETTKTTFELVAPASGYLFPLAVAGSEVPVGAPLALVAPTAQRPCLEPQPAAALTRSAGEQTITKKARVLIEANGLALEEFAALSVVREADVQEVLSKRQSSSPKPMAPVAHAPGSPRRSFGDEPLDADADWDALCDTDLHGQLKHLLRMLRKRMRARFNRHVSTGELLYDRWELAKDYGFGEGTSVYDSCLILGDVQVGRHCWVGPDSILDGGHAPLRIGDYVDVGAGTHIYTHNTIERALSGHKLPLFKKSTSIGSCCFLGPRSIIAPGTLLGDHCFVAAASYVEGVFASHSYIGGNPARQLGTVEIAGNKVRILPLNGRSRARDGR
jgi:acetyltransferase-like isoleucine patch superfamily enzyme